eukprot:scaffold6164_cov89-Skeletonema_dohrnii-CCMP3373.AAC.6
MQEDYIRKHHTDVTIDTWMGGHIDQLLMLFHIQWLCRNLTKHHRTKGAKALARRYTERYRRTTADMGADNCLLEIRPEGLFGMDTAKHQHWLNAAVTARSAAAYHDKLNI